LDDDRKIKRLGDTTATVSRTRLRTEPVRSLARPSPATVATGTALDESLRRMRAGHGDALLIIANGRLAGILTERDVLTRVLGQAVDQRQPVDDFMTAAPETLRADASLLEAMRAMERGNYRNVPVVDDDGALVGLLRQLDVLEYIAEAFPQEILNLPPRPHQLMEAPEGA
jgi:CBS domain-containing protein